jgi:hypothetical protein
MDNYGYTVLTFHNRTVLSSDPDANNTLEDDHAMSLIPFVCPSKFCMNSPVRESHNFISLSAAVFRDYARTNEPAEARYFPSGLNFTELTPFE